MNRKIVLCLGFVATVVATACGGGGTSNSPTSPGDTTTTNNPTRARITIVASTSTPTIWAGSIYGRFGAQSSTRVQFGTQDKYCAAAPARTCYFDVAIGDTVSVAATDNLAEISVGAYGRAEVPDDPRNIQSQFVSWSGPCTVRERGVCVLKATGDVTLTAQFKSLTFTKFVFTGELPWQLTITAPATLGLTSLTPAAPQTTFAHYGVFSTEPDFPICIGQPGGTRCIQVLTADNSSLKFEAYAVEGPPPLRAIRPMHFISFGGACSTGPSQFGVAACNLTSGTDQIAIVKWEYYLCHTSTGTPFATYSTGGWVFPADIEPGCVVAQ